MDDEEGSLLDQQVQDTYNDKRFIRQTEGGYRVRISQTLSKYFSATRYGSMDVARIAAHACRDHYLATGSFVVPPPVVKTKADWARMLGVEYRQFLAACKEHTLREAIERAKEGEL